MLRIVLIVSAYVMKENKENVHTKKPKDLCNVILNAFCGHNDFITKLEVRMRHMHKIIVTK